MPRLLSRSSVHVAGVFCLLLLAYHLIFRDYFPLPNGRMGHDYVLTLGALLDGYLWFHNNGFFTPPWFTPSFCGGQPFFADPQSIFYSVPQFLTFVTDPLQAVYWSFLIFAGIAFWGMYLFCSRSLQLAPLAAVAAATVFMFNGFYSTRMAVGHYGYQAFALAPLIAWLLTTQNEKKASRLQELLYTLLAGLLIAYCFHSGMTTLMIPLAIAIAALACLAQLRSQTAIAPRFFSRGTGAALLAIALSASKLSANLAVMGNFSRDFYPLPGIHDPVALASFVLQSLFYSSEHVYRSITPFWQNMQWSALPHELSYNLTPLSLIIILLAGGRQLAAYCNPDANRTSRREHHLGAILLLAGILCIPLGLLYYSPGWNQLLKSLPLIGSTTSPFRWLIIYIPFLAACVGLSSAAQGRFAVTAVITLVLGVPALNALEQRDFLQSQTFDPESIVSYYRQVRLGEKTPSIREIGIADPNNAQIADGISPAFCYNPLFGYRLEKFRVEPLEKGAVEALTTAGTLNMRNPSCLVFPNENHCRTWDAFTPAQREQLLAFANYQPLPFARSSRQIAADKITLLSLIVVCTSLLLLVARIIWQHTHRQEESQHAD